METRARDKVKRRGAKGMAPTRMRGDRELLPTEEKGEAPRGVPFILATPHHSDLWRRSSPPSEPQGTGSAEEPK